MKVLNVNAMLDPVTGGGTAERTFQLSRAMVNAGIGCRILTMDIGLTENVLRSMGELQITVLPCINKRFQVPRCTSRFIRQIVERVDIVHIMNHWSILNAIVCREARRVNKPYVVCPAGALPIYGRSKALKMVYNRLVGNRLIQNASGHVAITSAESHQFEPYGIDHKRVTVIPNGVNCEDKCVSNDLGFREKYHLGTHPFILFMGRINSIKGPDLLLNAFLNAKEQLGNHHLVFVGPDVGMLDELKSRVSECGASDRVHFIGYLDRIDKSGAYGAASVVAIPSRQEAMSMVVLEAGMAGKPVLITDQCGFSEVESVKGGVVVPATVDGLQRGLVKILCNPSQLNDMGNRLKIYTKEHFAWNVIVNRYLDLYHTLLKK